MTEHSQRQHAEWAASASARNAVCAGAIAMCSMTEEHESEAAAWGTAAHEVADACMQPGEALTPEFFDGHVKKVGRYTFTVDADMITCVETYLQRCDEEIAAEPCAFWVEESLPLDKLNPPLQAGGTGDLVIYRRQSKLLLVKDLKTGRGVFVDAKGSWQMRTYALGALLAHPDLDVEWVDVEIIQPRLERGGDGGVRSERFHVADLFEWAGTMLQAMQRAADAKWEFDDIQSNRVKFDEWAQRWLKTGQCTFCDAKALCPKFRAEALAALPKKAKEWFETPGDEPAPALSNAAMLLSTEELVHALNGVDAVKDWIKAVSDRGHTEASRGVALPGWKLVNKIGHRAWKSDDAAAVKLLGMGLKQEQVFKQKICSPAAADTLLKKRKTEIADLWEKPIRGTNLVRAESDRPTVKSKAAQHHEQVE
jgi:hypothetical protein